MEICYIFFPIWYVVQRKNLATLLPCPKNDERLHFERNVFGHLPAEHPEFEIEGQLNESKGKTDRRNNLSKRKQRK
jgi:hypothetical protein